MGIKDNEDRWDEAEERLLELGAKHYQSSPACPDEFREFFIKRGEFEKAKDYFYINDIPHTLQVQDGLQQSERVETTLCLTNVETQSVYSAVVVETFDFDNNQSNAVDRLFLQCVEKHINNLAGRKLLCWQINSEGELLGRNGRNDYTIIQATIAGLRFNFSFVNIAPLMSEQKNWMWSSKFNSDQINFDTSIFSLIKEVISFVHLTWKFRTSTRYLEQCISDVYFRTSTLRHDGHNKLE